MLKVICTIISIIEGYVLIVVKVLVECKILYTFREFEIILNPYVYSIFKFKCIEL